jgi:TRAP-type C4-dicarboxylate transport system permease small subunit
MEVLYSTTKKITQSANFIAGVLLALMMLLTCSDVVLRYLGKPITGTFELMSYAGAIVAGFAIAQTSMDGAHVNVDMLTQVVHGKALMAVKICTKLISLGVFVIFTYALFLKGIDLYDTHEVSLTLQVPYYPVAYGLSLASFIESLVLLTQIFKIIGEGGKHE